MAMVSWVPLLNNKQTGYPALDGLVIGYLAGSRRDIQVLAGEKSSCQHNSAITKMMERFSQEDRACLHVGYPESLVGLFRIRGFSLWRVPVADLTQWAKEHNARACDNSTHREEDSIVRFTDAHGHPGLAMHAHGWSSPEEDIINVSRIRDLICYGLPYFATYSVSGSGVISGSGECWNPGKRNGPNCSISYNICTGVPAKTITEIPQIEQLLPPEIAKVEMSKEKTEESSLWTRMTSSISGIWRKFW